MCPLLSNFLARIKYARSVQRTKEHWENEVEKERENASESTKFSSRGALQF